MRWKVYKGGYTLKTKLPKKLELIGIYECESEKDIIKYMAIYPTNDDEDIYAVARTIYKIRYIIAYKRDILGELNG